MWHIYTHRVLCSHCTCAILRILPQDRGGLHWTIKAGIPARLVSRCTNWGSRVGELVLKWWQHCGVPNQCVLVRGVCSTYWIAFEGQQESKTACRKKFFPVHRFFFFFWRRRYATDVKLAWLLNDIKTTYTTKCLWTVFLLFFFQILGSSREFHLELRRAAWAPFAARGSFAMLSIAQF